MADSEYSNLAVAQFTAIQKEHVQRNTADSPPFALRLVYLLHIPFKIILVFFCFTASSLTFKLRILS